MTAYKVGKKKIVEDKFFLGKSYTGCDVYLSNFHWSCGWYWGGGHLDFIKRNVCIGTVTFKSAMLQGKFMDYVNEVFDYTPLSKDEWWKLMDLMKQFYKHQESAECFSKGGNISGKVLELDTRFINPEMAEMLNKHIEGVIIPNVRKLFEDLEY